ncbi:hypothetical protein G6L37_06615 [Agrobacterium rubi]|nr:hypothetical protein [Agrobacterium rubi]NTF25036.1 hypothetical protein [Agrobacterium rubi]
MPNNLEEAVVELWNVEQPDQTPLEFANLREKAIVEGLHALAGYYDKEIDYTYIDANGELNFFIKGASQGRGGEYGEDLAEMLSRVSRRTGISSTKSPVLPENNWCRINHFEAERLLKIAGSEIYGIEGPEYPSIPKA